MKEETISKDALRSEEHRVDSPGNKDFDSEKRSPRREGLGKRKKLIVFAVLGVLAVGAFRPGVTTPGL